MTFCATIRPALGGYVLGGLEPDETRDVEEHLHTCERCRSEVDDLAGLPPLLDLIGDPLPPAPADLRRRVLAATPRPRRQVPMLVAAALAILAAISGALATSAVSAPPPPDVTVAMRGTDAVGIVGQAHLRQVEAGVGVDLELRGVRDAGDGYYHVWLERDGRRVSAGTFVGSTDGEIRAELLCGGLLEDYDRVIVTWSAYRSGDEVVAAHGELAT